MADTNSSNAFNVQGPRFGGNGGDDSWDSSNKENYRPRDQRNNDPKKKLSVFLIPLGE